MRSPGFGKTDWRIMIVTQNSAVTTGMPRSETCRFHGFEKRDHWVDLDLFQADIRPRPDSFPAFLFAEWLKVPVESVCHHNPDDLIGVDHYHVCNRTHCALGIFRIVRTQATTCAYQHGQPRPV